MKWNQAPGSRASSNMVMKLAGSCGASFMIVAYHGR
jgi:hypothetical protein